MKLFTYAVIAGLILAAHAEEVHNLNWQDLTVKMEFDDPFEKLTPEQLMNLSIYVRCAKLEKQGKASEGMIKEKKEKEAWLRAQGVDIEGLLSKREEIRELRTKRAAAMDESLDGQVIRMPGYALALEYDGRKITEFLLVPWVGACIHTPPPPPNQIVYVKSEQAFEVGNRFEPVWIEGVMHVGQTSKALFLVDGTSDISVGYSMSAAKVERYEKGPKAEVRPAEHS